MKTKLSILLLFIGVIFVAAAQTTPVAVPKGANHFVYEARSFDTEKGITDVYLDGSVFKVVQRDTTKGKGPFIPGYSAEESYFDLAEDSIYTFTSILRAAGSTAADTFLTAAPYKAMQTKFDTAKVGGLTRYTCSVNSNKLEFYVQDYPLDITPITYYGRFPGLLVSFWRNGNCYIQLKKADKAAPSSKFQMPAAQRVTSRELGTIKRERMVITTRLFDSVQLSWGKPNSHIEGDILENTPYDSVLHFAGGTLALRRMRLPHLPAHYQTFVEIHQRSNGDAYDRTGSLFVFPAWNPVSFFRGMNEHPDSLPLLFDRQGRRYQGIRIEGDTLVDSKITYDPPLELVRFFTSFGVGHFNDRVQLDGLRWQQENYFKQEVTELSSWLGTNNWEDVWVGIWIGNYDGGGHIVTVDLKSYPNEYEWAFGPDSPQRYARSLFNTCNVLEMAGQNYGRLFATDSLTATFTVPAFAKNTRLRYITTGHGGWDGGDEFNPKSNTILIDGKPIYTYTPWRCDCGRYREWNPVSGNFWNGTSSSDYSRSGWCPGTATQPVYIDLGNLAPGRHTVTVAIPQGQDEGTSFSHWCVSGALLFED